MRAELTVSVIFLLENCTDILSKKVWEQTQPTEILSAETHIVLDSREQSPVQGGSRRVVSLVNERNDVGVDLNIPESESNRNFGMKYSEAGT